MGRKRAVYKFPSWYGLRELGVSETQVLFTQTSKQFAFGVLVSAAVGRRHERSRIVRCCLHVQQRILLAVAYLSAKIYSYSYYTCRWKLNRRKAIATYEVVCEGLCIDERTKNNNGYILISQKSFHFHFNFCLKKLNSHKSMNKSDFLTNSSNDIK